MTLDEWNRLQVGDFIRSIRCPDHIYKVTALEPDEEWPVKEWGDKDENGNEFIIISHQVWTVDPGNPNDCCNYDPGECEDFERCQPPKEKPVGGLITR